MNPRVTRITGLEILIEWDVMRPDETVIVCERSYLYTVDGPRPTDAEMEAYALEQIASGKWVL